jgi:flagellar motor component MotA
MGRRTKNDSVLILLIIILVVIMTIIKAVGNILAFIASFLIHFKWEILIILSSAICLFILYYAYVNYYFISKKFKRVKNSISEHTKNCNELNHHISELKCAYVNIKTYDYGSASIEDKSKYSYKRDEWSRALRNDQTYNCSAAVCKSANEQPMKYLCKYFNIDIDENSLSRIEDVLNDFAAAEEGKRLLQTEREEILKSLSSSIPWLIRKFNSKKLIEQLGFENIDLSDLYFPVYTFQYVSAGGNSSMRSKIRLDIENLDRLVEYMKGLVKFRKSIVGQRSLMTLSLREKIKIRDNFTCKICGLSIDDEKNLLLEIDHVIPLSKGGITSEDNLQTLCWKCNRSKGSKVFLV